MTIRRAPRPADNFAQIHNSALEDERLSWRARGLLAYLLSRPPGWTTTSEKLAGMGKEGRDAVRTALKELEQFGYLYRSRTRNQQTKSWEHEQWVTDQPSTMDGFSGVGFSGDINNTESNNTYLTPPPPPPSSPTQRASADDDDQERKLFADFCTAHPKVERPKVVAAAWKLARTKASAEQIIEGARGYARLCKQEDKEPRFIATATNWLNEERWNDSYPAQSDKKKDGWWKSAGD